VILTLHLLCGCVGVRLQQLKLMAEDQAYTQELQRKEFEVELAQSAQRWVGRGRAPHHFIRSERLKGIFVCAACVPRPPGGSRRARTPRRRGVCSSSSTCRARGGSPSRRQWTPPVRPRPPSAPRPLTR
jgi:hypothetical protein